MAKQNANQQQPSKTPAPLVPIETDPRTELFFLIGKAGYECNPPMANRMMELVVVLTAPARRRLQSGAVRFRMGALARMVAVNHNKRIAPIGRRPLMATLYRTDGTLRFYSLNGVNWSLPELQTLVGGYFELVLNRRWPVHGHRRRGEVEAQAYQRSVTLPGSTIHGRHDPVVGEALVVDTRLEMNGPEEEE